MPEGEIIYTPMPETEMDIWNWFDETMNSHGGSSLPIKALLERVWAAPMAGRKQGGSSMFTFGQNFGSMRMALTAIGAEWETPTPQQWMKGLGIPVVKDESQPQRKERLRGVAQKLLPKLELWKEPRSLGKQRAVADALLIAIYCQRKHNGL